jgi:hypothetical protein
MSHINNVCSTKSCDSHDEIAGERDWLFRITQQWHPIEWTTTVKLSGI